MDRDRTNPGEPRNYELTDDLLYDPAVGRATMMGYPCVRLAGRFLASYDDKAGHLVAEPPSPSGSPSSWAKAEAEPFAPAGKVFREWAPTAPGDRELWADTASPKPWPSRARIRP